MSNNISSGYLSNNTININTPSGTYSVKGQAANQGQQEQQSVELKPGDSINGEIVSRDGNDVQLRIARDIILNARLDQEIQASAGDQVMFEVRTNNSGNISLRPLFQNLSQESPVFKALQQAGLPVDGKSAQMVEAMMKEGMRIDSESLQIMYKEVLDMPNTGVGTLVQMSKLDIPPTPENIQQFEAYKNFEHKLGESFAKVADEIPGAVEDAISTGGPKEGNDLIGKVLDTFSYENQADTGSTGTIPAKAEGPVPELSLSGNAQDQALLFNKDALTAGGQDPIAGEGIRQEDVKNPEGNSPGVTNDQAAVPEGEKVIISEESVAAPEESVIKPEGKVIIPEGKEDTANGNIRDGQNQNIEINNVIKEGVPNPPNDNAELSSKQPGIQGETQTVNNGNDRTGSEAANNEGQAAKDFSASADKGQIPLTQDSRGSGVEQNSSRVFSEETQMNKTYSDPESQNQPLKLSPRQANELAALIKNAGGSPELANKVLTGKATGNEVYEAVRNLSHRASDEQSMNAVKDLFTSKAFQSVLKERISSQWSINNKEQVEKQEIKDLYERIERQTRDIAKALSDAAKPDSPLAKSIMNIRENVDFINQLNQLTSYVQLPLKWQGMDAHGDLYVYTNKKNLAGKDGHVSAFLHLDMQHLGVVDVYVSMEKDRVSTNFTVEDDETLDLLDKNMDILTKRLEEKGYTTTARLSLKGEDETDDQDGAMAGILKDKRNISVVSVQAFDARA